MWLQLTSNPTEFADRIKQMLDGSKEKHKIVTFASIQDSINATYAQVQSAAAPGYKAFLVKIMAHYCQTAAA